MSGNLTGMKAWSRVVRGSDYNCGEMGSSHPSMNKVSSVSGLQFSVQHISQHNYKISIRRVISRAAQKRKRSFTLYITINKVAIFKLLKQLPLLEILHG